MFINNRTEENSSIQLQMSLIKIKSGSLICNLIHASQNNHGKNLIKQ